MERSTNAQNFVTIGSVAATGLTDYSFTDLAAAKGNNYCRLKMIDHDGKQDQSVTRQLQITSTASLTIHANPVTNGVLSFTFNGLANNTGLSICITNKAGQLVKTAYMAALQNNTAYAVGLNGAGIYYLHCTLTDGQKFVRKIVVTK